MELWSRKRQVPKGGFSYLSANTDFILVALGETCCSVSIFIQSCVKHKIVAIKSCCLCVVCHWMAAGHYLLLTKQVTLIKVCVSVIIYFKIRDLRYTIYLVTHFYTKIPQIW